MNFDEYAAHDALGLAELVRKGEVSVAELEETARRGIEAVNGTINAVVGDVPLAEGRQETSSDAVFHGVPFLLKDLAHGYAGVPCEMGSRMGVGYINSAESVYGTRCKASGLVAVGRTNTPEFGQSGTTEPVANGSTLNPYDLAVSAGGSSGGAAAAVAAGVVPIAHASDAGGSIRIPAGWTGLVGHKPTRGLVSKGPQASDATVPLSVNLVVTRTVRDTAAFMDAITGPGPGDYVAVPKPERGYLESLHDPVAPLKIAVCDAFPGGMPSDPELVANARAVATGLEAMGHSVEEATPDVDMLESHRIGYDLFLSRVQNFVTGLATSMGRELGPDMLEAMTLAALEEARAMTVERLYDGLASLERLSLGMDLFMADYDLLVMPGVSKAPFQIGFADPQRAAPSGPSYLADEMPYCAMSPMFNVSGQPALVIPPLEQTTKVPLGVQLSGKKGSDALLFQVATQLEAEAGWQHRRPPAHVAA
ncbi:MAG: amidase [Rhodospirillaceae bacterium]|jgi:amidase|nr:amidase [Rhodospirillaceae bacterium]MBT6509576.1 amidase [Rhodospirillaceae bacterium]MBT7615219.1 amidase [Rhodospirillaceae bacterium]MBT7646102.1 amidase [Rhodospirillaceae bacterium]